jgi:G2/mitotic-specific cyclin-B, other
MTFTLWYGFRENAKMLVSSHMTAPESKLRVVYKKYSSEHFEGVALRPPAVLPINKD